MRLILLFFLFFECSKSANILVFHCLGCRTHLLSFLPFLQRLTKDGHHITVFQADEKLLSDLGANISTIDVVYKREPNPDFAKLIFTSTLHGYMLPMIYHMMGTVFETIVQTNAEQFSSIFAKDYDLVLIDELFTLHGMFIASYLQNLKGIPYVVYSPTHHVAFVQELIGAGRNYAATMSLFTSLPESEDDKYQPSKFTDRLFSVGESVSEAFVTTQIYPFFIKIHKHFPFGKQLDFSGFFANSWLNFDDHFDKLGQIFPSGQDSFAVGSHCESASSTINDNELPKEYLDFVNDPSSKGTIYVAFGSAISWEGAPEHLKSSLLSAFEELEDYRIIWSFNGKFPETKSKNIKFSKWTPQAAILAHKKTRVFLTHGGLKSLKESICAKVPVVLMPILAEQAFNAKICLQLEIGLVLHKIKLTKQKVVSTLKKVLSAETFSKNVQKIKSIYLDQVSSPLDVGSHQITKLLRLRSEHGNTKYDQLHRELLNRKGRFLYKINYYLLDSFSAIFLLILFLK